MVEKMKINEVLTLCLNNEIDIDRSLIKRLGIESLGYTPVRPIKTEKILKKYRINKRKYFVINILFLIFSPIFLLYKFFINFELKKGEIQSAEKVLLVSNGRATYLLKKIHISNIMLLNVNQDKCSASIDYKSGLSFFDFFKSYFISLFFTFSFFFSLKDKKHLIQSYVVFDLVLFYLFANKHCEKFNTIIFSNHYDRWAVMFDLVFSSKELILLQHGVLPDNLDLSYKLRNLNHIYVFDEKSVDAFNFMYNCKNTKFTKYDIKLNLAELPNKEKVILLIGQPHSIGIEINIAEILSTKFTVIIKPHPLYCADPYRKVSNVAIIDDKNYFPKVDLALCYESTLGLEYQASGVEVLWWKGMSVDQIISKVEDYLGCEDV